MPLQPAAQPKNRRGGDRRSVLTRLKAKAVTIALRMQQLGGATRTTVTCIHMDGRELQQVRSEMELLRSVNKSLNNDIAALQRKIRDHAENERLVAQYAIENQQL